MESGRQSRTSSFAGGKVPPGLLAHRPPQAGINFAPFYGALLLGPLRNSIACPQKRAPLNLRHGVTLIYGPKRVGKSVYCRIAKKILSLPP